MHYIISQDGYGRMGFCEFSQISPETLVDFFNANFRTKYGLYYLMKKIILDRMVNQNLLDGIFEEVGVYAIHINTMHDFNQLILKYFDQFWLQVQTNKTNSQFYAESMWESYPRVYQTKFGKHVALLTSHQETLYLKNASEVVSFQPLKTYFNRDLLKQETVLSEVKSYIEKLMTSI